MIRLLISEEYGYRYWLAELTEEEYQELLLRWATMRGLHCLVPVKLIIPQAKELVEEKIVDFYSPGYLRCHIHECDDSYLEGSSYEIPNSTDERWTFWMEGKKYTSEDLDRLQMDTD